MVASDNQSTALHGQFPLRDVDNYLDDNFGFSIVVFVDYDCEAYHAKIKDAFMRLPMPSMPHDMNLGMKPFFRVLQHDGPIAEATAEQLQLSETLEESLNALQGQSPEMPSEWNFDNDLVYPYPKLYHCNHILVGPLKQNLDLQQQTDLQVLSKYIDERLTSEYKGMEELAATGMVDRKHWMMLFLPDDTAITLQEGQYRAYTVKSCRLVDENTLEMDCWSWDELSSEELENDEPPGGAFTLMLPPTIKGYGFHNKKWNTLLVEHIQDIKWNSGVFENRLVLQEDKKELVKALVTVHIEKSREIKTDFMDGKGEGLIILLHGGPGTGKTLTAESIAELVHRPLYRVTCGDIGTDAESVEKYLESALFIGNTWDCVVLLDEADVFLEERTKMDLQRNALVSVFLRVLEYYDGILILTTNRIGTFDEAFKSRIQLALHYPPLNRDGRWEVWRNFVKSLSEAGENINTEEITNKLDILARHKLNGRQIRNTINTARQLARYKKDSLRYAHVDQAVRVVNEFEKYVTDVHGHDDEEYARDQGLRNDDALQVD
ncbi:uncharacterized protein J4E84_007387 [Alternaria hordeiaustralica]|uniref:uncharacterized protein n=1 Tax=Alternaria hordeiaustralica TaxID=1187925 RepID=UPI0020C541BE|nr:uncharacterized protein J4E84_007387 [Alternaria hordeiaustralica]KAI4681791.1 hypothetical protein J4E84_007387 [Alternaria hordeiaustralica]